MSDNHAIFRYGYQEFLVAHANANHHVYSRGWCGGLDTVTTRRHARLGEDSNVPKANALLDKLQGSVQTPRRRWSPNVCGGYVCVPEYLQGVPDCMRHRRPVLDAASPITVYASIMASCGVDADTMMRRGIAILALVLKLQAIRPISLYAVCPWIGTTLVIEIPTKPLSIAHAAFALSHPAYFRRLGHDVLYSTGDECTVIANDTSAARRLNMRPHDLYVGTGVSSLDWHGEAKSKYATVLQDPVGWINETIKAHARL